MGDEEVRRQALLLVVAYDGRSFAGSQLQPGQRTVQAELMRAIEEVYGHPARIVFAGRTDRGVHAVGQVVSLRDPRPQYPTITIQRALNAHLPVDLAVVRVERRDPRFNARYDARWREYRYRIWTGQQQPLANGAVWQRSGALAPEAMQAAATKLIGRRDFAAFAGGGAGVPWSSRQDRPRGTVRRLFISEVSSIEPWWRVVPDEWRLIEVRVVADGFLPRMVRNIVGALVEIGRGARSIALIDELLEGRDRRLAPMTVPADGLILWRVGYEGDDPGDGERGGRA